jgi:hypothetical protein
MPNNFNAKRAGLYSRGRWTNFRAWPMADRISKQCRTLKAERRSLAMNRVAESSAPRQLKSDDAKTGAQPSCSSPPSTDRRTEHLPQCPGSRHRRRTGNRPRRTTHCIASTAATLDSAGGPLSCALPLSAFWK